MRIRGAQVLGLAAVGFVAPLTHCRWILGASDITYQASAGPVGLLRIAAGSEDGYPTTCAIGGPANALYCWGINEGNFLGEPDSGGNDIVDAPLLVRGPGESGQSDVAQISLFSDTPCSTWQGNAYCWGANANLWATGMSASDPTSPVRQVDDSILPDVVQVAVGGNIACAVTSKEVLYCWGDGSVGQIIPQYANTNGPVKRAVEVMQGVRQVALGYAHDCVIRTDGGVSCWGMNDTFQTGQAGSDATCTISNDLNEYPCVLTPRPVPGLADIRQLALGYTHSCALAADGSVYCWGFDGAGQLGATPLPATSCADVMAGTSAGANGPCSATPVKVNLAGPASFIAVDVAQGPELQSSCAVVGSNGNVYCWGANHFAVLGTTDPGISMSAEPLLISNADGKPFAGAVELALNYDACALDTKGNLDCWGLVPTLPAATPSPTLVPWSR
jgi:alpha-tubulin suppressor-like RCC1 family protein